jgi:hypothetical protein
MHLLKRTARQKFLREGAREMSGGVSRKSLALLFQKNNPPSKLSPDSMTNAFSAFVLRRNSSENA